MTHSIERPHPPVDAEALKQLFSSLTIKNRVDIRGESAPLVDIEDPVITEQLARLETEAEVECFVLPYYWLTKNSDPTGQYTLARDVLVFYKNSGVIKTETRTTIAEYVRRTPRETHTYTFDGVTVLDSHSVLEKGSLVSVSIDQGLLTEDDVLSVYNKFSKPQTVSYDDFIEEYLPSNFK